jgi:transposase
MSALLGECGHAVIVADPRRLRLLTTSDQKNDPQDARMLAQMVWAKPALLAPVRHRSAEPQRDLNLVNTRDLLVEARTKLINGGVSGERLGGAGASMQFSQQAHLRMPEEARPALTRYPQTAVLKQVCGVGTLSAIAFVLTIEEPQRFQRSRDVGCYLGLRPRQQDSGDRSPQLRITKAGDSYLRKTMVSCAHYILGPFGTGHGSAALGVEAVGARRQERQEAGGGQEAGGVTASIVGDRGGV